MKAWLVKDARGRIYLYYNDKPRKIVEAGIWCNKYFQFMVFTKKNCPLLGSFKPKWSDKEPTEVELTMTKAKED